MSIQFAINKALEVQILNVFFYFLMLLFIMDFIVLRNETISTSTLYSVRTRFCCCMVLVMESFFKAIDV